MKDTRPNVLLLLTDQQRLDTIQALGSHFNVATPNMDRLVREGVSFTNCHCTAPICSPSRSTLMTGYYPSQVGMPGNLYTPCPPLSPAQMTLGKRMLAAGYETVYHGKWHLGGDVQDYGFEAGEECSHDESTRMLAARFWRDRDWLEHDRPFFHVVSFLDPHDVYFYDPLLRVEGFERPWNNLGCPDNDYPEAVRKNMVKWEEARWGAYHQFYAERVGKVDRDIGLLFDDLRCSGFLTNTWIIFASDHGDMAGEHNIPFKGSFMYEGVTKVPLVVVPPQNRFIGDFARPIPQENIEVGRSSDSLCSLIDIVPSILELAGIEAPHLMPGKSLLPHIRGEVPTVGHSAVFAEWHIPGVRMARSHEWKYVIHQNGDEEFFHLVEDPAESHNRVADPDAATPLAVLKTALQDHLRQTKDPWADLAKHAFMFSPSAIDER